MHRTAWKRATPIRLAAGAAALALGLGTYALTSGAAAPARLILNPLLTGGDQGTQPWDMVIPKISGYVDFDGSQGRIYLHVAQREGDNVVWRGKYDWPGPPASSCTVTNGVRKCPFEFTKTTDGQPIQPFKSSTPSSSPLRFPDGGVGMMRFYAQVGQNPAQLIPVRDSLGVLGQTDRLILSDTSPTPADARFIGARSYLARRKPTGLDPAGLRADTKAYYMSVRINPTGSETIYSHLDTLDKFKARYFGPIRSGTGFPREPADCVAPSIDKTSTTFFNRGDLGLGRGMRCIQNQCTGETACYVHNYARVDRDGAGNVTKVYFDDFNGAKEAANAGKQFATVAMVERRWMGLNDNQVLFIAYADKIGPDGKQLLYEAPLDNHQNNTHIPSNCLSCHGINATYTRGTKTDGTPDNRVSPNAAFLPFDLQAYDYFSSSAPLSRESQEYPFYRLNQMVYWTDMWGNAEFVNLMRAWYGSDWSFPQNRTDTRRRFKNDAVPEPQIGRGTESGITPWNLDANTRQAYVKVYQKACRTCHISAESFASTKFEAFSDLKGPLAHVTACRLYSMPQAEQTAREFWGSSARSHLLDRFGLTNHWCDVQ